MHRNPKKCSLLKVVYRPYAEILIGVNNLGQTSMTEIRSHIISLRARGLFVEHA
jgi:hypothetical protein